MCSVSSLQSLHTQQVSSTSAPDVLFIVCVLSPLYDFNVQLTFRTCTVPAHAAVRGVCATPVTNTFQCMAAWAPESPEQQASSRLQLSVEAPVEALGVLTLSPCCAHAERACRVVCTRVAHSRRSRGALAALTRRSLGPARVGDGDVRAGLGRPGVEEDGDDDERGAAPEAVVRGEVEEGHGGEARQKDRERLVRGGV